MANVIQDQDDPQSVEDGLKEMRKYFDEFKEKQKGSDLVRHFLENAFRNDEALLIRYLIGRKYRAKHAWESLRSYAEMRFDKYPEMFPATLPPKNFLFFEDNLPIFAILKERDSKGRRIAYFLLKGWDTEKCSLDQLNILVLPIIEKVLCDEDCLKNGLIFVHDCSGMGMSHARKYTLSAMLRSINIYWYSFPLKFKGAYFVNVPPIFSYVFAIVKPFLPNKLKQRLLLSTSSRGFEELHERLPSSILPKCLGGKLEADEAIDTQFIEF